MHPVPRHPDRGWIHAVPVLLTLATVVVSTVVLVLAFRSANADVATRPGAPFGAAASAFMTFVAATLISTFLTMLAYTVARLGRTQTTRVLQLIGLGVTLVGAVAGGALALLIPSTF